MTERIPLRALNAAEAAKFKRNFQTTGPMKVSNAAFIGDTDYLCPACKAVLFQGTNAVGIATINFIACYSCGAHSSGASLVV